MIALAMFPLYAYLGYTAYSLRSEVEPYNESGKSIEKPYFGFFLANIQKASFGAAIGFVLIGL